MINLFHFSSPDVAGSSESERITVYAENGGRAELQCPVKPEIPGDEAVLVLFYRDSRTEPVYRWVRLYRYHH